MQKHLIEPCTTHKIQPDYQQVAKRWFLRREMRHIAVQKHGFYKPICGILESKYRDAIKRNLPLKCQTSIFIKRDGQSQACLNFAHRMIKMLDEMRHYIQQ